MSSARPDESLQQRPRRFVRACFDARYWRVAVLVLLPLLALAGMMALAPIAQDLSYHRFADTRSLLGVPNAGNVVSNIPFLAFGIAGLWFCLTRRPPGARTAWTIFFAGVALVCFGSGYYHTIPTSASLVWDRAPMTVAFMALFVALLSEHVGKSLERYLLVPAILIGLASIGWWRYADDLRFYVWVQAAPLLAIPLVLLLFQPRYTHRMYLLYGLGSYALAKVAELYDQQLFAFTGYTFSGHSLKHVLASASALCVYLMLRRRQPVV